MTLRELSRVLLALGVLPMLGCSEDAASRPRASGGSAGLAPSGGAGGAISSGGSGGAVSDAGGGDTGVDAAALDGYFVAPTGDDANPGTLASPWRTLQHALDTLAPAETAYVRAGTYAEGAAMTRAGADGAWITLASYPGETAVIRPPENLPSGDHHGLEIKTGAAYFRLQGFVIENAYANDCSAHPLTIYGAHHVVISDNRIRGGRAGSGVYLEEESAFVSILRNTISDNRDDVDCNGGQAHGIYAQGTDHVVANNVIYDHVEGYGIQGYDAGARNLFAHNTVVGNAFSGIVLGGAKGYDLATVANNVFAMNGAYGVSWDSDLPENCVVVQNLAFSNANGAVEPGAPASCQVSGTSTSDPGFLDAANHDYRLAPGSPAIDVADAAFVVSPDHAGVIRPVGPGADLGAFERP